MKSYFSLFTNYANFSGFMKRGAYWTAMIIHWIILLVPLYPLGRYLVDDTYVLPSFYLPWVLPLWCFYFLLMIIPVWSATVRRFHTLPRKGWWLLIGIIPVVGSFIILIWLLQKGNYEEFLKKIKKAGAGTLEEMFKAAERPRNGAWFFPVFILLAAGGWFLNRQIIQSGSREQMMAAIQEINKGGLASLRDFNIQKTAAAVPVQENRPVRVLKISKGEPITSLRDGSISYLITDNVAASKYAVSYGQYNACVSAGVCEPSALVNVDAYPAADKNLFHYLKENGLTQLPDYFKLLGENGLDYAADLPMVDVTVEQASDYCSWTGMRLPEASEWLKAAEGAVLSVETANCVGTDLTSYFRSAAISNAMISKTIPVTAMENNAQAHEMIQMAGNVWEWIAPAEGAEMHLAMGGAWNSYPVKNIEDAVFETEPGYAANNIGFRCFADAESLTSDLFTDGKPIEEALGESENTAETAVEVPVEEIPVEDIVITAAANDMASQSTAVLDSAAKKLPVSKETPEMERSASDISPDEETEQIPEETSVPETEEPAVGSTEDSGQEVTPEAAIRVEAGMPVIAKQDGTILLLTEDDVLASVYAVTVGQYARCAADDGCEMPEGLETLAYPSEEIDTENLPMVYVTFEQAAAYCEWAGMRLPTVSEWKTAAIPADGMEYTSANANTVGTNRRAYIHTEEQRALTVPVTAFRSGASATGMVQMAGNVWEWASPDQAGSSAAAALGGAWNSYPESVGPDAEMETLPGYAADNIGFRCFADPETLTSEKFEVSTTDVEVLLNPGLWSAKGVRAKDNAEMVYIPAAVFSMGAANGAVDEKPTHEVTLSAYWIDAHEITNEQYALCVAEGVCTEPHETKSLRQASYYGNPAFNNYPVIAVDRMQAQTYCEWAETRLPTEAEWEYAAKGPDGNAYPWGNSFISANLNYSGNGNYDTLAVNASPEDVSSLGVYNLGGNVSEWVFDRYQENWYSVTDQPIDPTGPETGNYYVIRGASAQTGENNARTADRFYANGTSFGLDRGFRCAVKEAE